MMRRGIIFCILLVFFQLFLNINEIYAWNNSPEKTIPDEAIRLRILANSDSKKDQYIKNIVRDEVNSYINGIVQHIDDIEIGRETIQQSIPEIQKIAESTLESYGIDQTVSVEYGKNIYFPLKVYDQYVYPAGEYEAVLITIGKGKGANWWCVLFPPLCFLDFSNGTVVSDEEEELDDHNDEEIEEEEEDYVVKFFLFEWLGLS